MTSVLVNQEKNIKIGDIVVHSKLGVELNMNQQILNY